jgi:CRP-like cAMP-binding protein
VTELPHNQNLKASFNARAFVGRADVGKTIEKYQKHQEIFAQGEAAETVFYIQKGKVKVTVLSEHGKDAVVGILSQGQFFGEGCLTGAISRTATTRAMEECLLTSLTKAAMMSALNKEPSFPRFLCHIFCRGIAGSRKIWLISYLIRAKEDSHAFSFFWRISARKARSPSQLP